MLTMNITLLQIGHTMLEIHITNPPEFKIEGGGGSFPPPQDKGWWGGDGSNILPVLILKYHLLLYYSPEITGA